MANNSIQVFRYNYSETVIEQLREQLFEAELSMELYKLILEEYDYQELVSALYGIFLPTFKK